MLTQQQANELAEEIKKEQKNSMKAILNHAKMALDDSKFEIFKKVTFNTFGLSGLETSVKKVIQKYVVEQ